MKRNIGSHPIPRDRRRNGGFQDWGMGSQCLTGTEFQWGEDEKVLQTDGGDGCTTL